MMPMKFLLFIPIFFCTVHSAFAIEISEGMLNKYVEQKLAEKQQKGQRDVRVINPKITLLDGYATLCASVQIKVLPQEIDLCANMTPQWRQETGSLLATNMSLISLNAPWIKGNDVELLKEIVNQAVLPKLEGREIYKADDFIGKRISGLKVLPGKLDISM